MSLLLSSSEILLRQRGEILARLGALEHLLGLLAHGRFVLAFGLQQDVAGARTCSGVDTARCSACRTPRSRSRHGDLLAHLIDVDERVADLALLADAIGLLALVEVRREIGVADRDLAAERVGRERTTSSLTFSLRRRYSSATSRR